MEQSPLKREQQKARIKDMRVKVASPDNPTILIEGVLYGARYLGSTQLSTEGRPSKSLRMMQVYLRILHPLVVQFCVRYGFIPTLLHFLVF